MAATHVATDAISSNAEASPDERGGTRYGTLIVVGGGCYGSYYVRQLGRARAAGALAWERLIVVDRDSGCRIATERSAGLIAAVDLELVTEDGGPLSALPWRGRASAPSQPLPTR